MALSSDPVKRDSQAIRFKAIKSGMTEEQYKDWLFDLFKVTSASALDTRQRAEAHRTLAALLVATGNDTKPTDGWREPQINKLLALWGVLADAGTVRVRGREALERWSKRQQPRLSALRFASVQQLAELIEALKQWAKRVDVKVD
ncbi:regulatory protein GemA [Herbaspirillum lusitanum]|uniref:regulatory protein GemA n=1 Tax=Herbaspirillum lusitanum TaxID=213312 RepID=UPI0022378270|nr:regulatory protein GemA [Herbaspirillum lusitanum]MCW5300879.1 regulatory protein GemA [Herbaspirillum lusitanum]